MKNYKLLQRFTVYSLIAFVITGIIIGIVISTHIKRVQLSEIQADSVHEVNSLIRPYLTPQIMNGNLTDIQLANLNDKFTQLKLISDIFALRIINPQGIVFYSDNPRLIDSSFNEKISIISKNQVNLEVNTYDKLMFPNLVSESGKIIKIWIPITSDTQTLGFFEAIVNYDLVNVHIIELNKNIVVIILSGFLILYFLLIRVMYNASKRLLEQNESLIKQDLALKDSYLRLNTAYKNTIITLSKTVDTKDSYTAGHSERVARISLSIGETLGMSQAQLQTLEQAALFHDIGKLGVPDNILNKPSKLTNEEFAKIKEHSVVGANILSNVDFLQEIIPIIRHHHEGFSGNGYPDGISGKLIPLESRIIAIADTYDAMTSDRPYRKGLPKEEALSELVRCKNFQFDPEIVDVFLYLNCMVEDGEGVINVAL